MAKVVDMPRRQKPAHNLKVSMIGPAEAAELLEANTDNRPVSDRHVQRIQRQIEAGKWQFNGDTIKIAKDRKVIDGQHRLFAIIESGVAVETAVVTDIDPGAFSTVDTISKARSGADTLSRLGLKRHQQSVAMALQWLMRYQNECIPTYRQPQNKIENGDIEEAYLAHPTMVDAAEKTRILRRILNHGVATAMFYLMYNKNQEMAEFFVRVLDDPAGLSSRHPFFILRDQLLTQKEEARPMDPIIAIAWTIKAWNYARQNKKIEKIKWSSTGRFAESFPVLQ